MTLVPWWLQAADRLMFLHVLRDGRDIAFSANQGPVSKFYAPMYSKQGGAVRGNVPTGAVPAKAIKLWADWNNGLRIWAEEKRRQLSGKGGAGGKEQQFDYLSVHIEHLVDPSDVVRLDAIARLAQFVGSGEGASRGYCCCVECCRAVLNIRDVCLSVCLSVCLIACLFVCLIVYLIACLSV